MGSQNMRIFPYLWRIYAHTCTYICTYWTYFDICAHIFSYSHAYFLTKKRIYTHMRIYAHTCAYMQKYVWQICVIYAFGSKAYLCKYAHITHNLQIFCINMPSYLCVLCYIFASDFGPNLSYFSKNAHIMCIYMKAYLKHVHYIYAYAHTYLNAFFLHIFCVDIWTISAACFCTYHKS